MEIWFENIRNPTVYTLMNNLDNHFWIDYLHNLTDNFSQEGLLQDFDEIDHFSSSEPFFSFLTVEFLGNFIWGFDEEKLDLYTPHLSKKNFTKVFATITLVIGHMIKTCSELSSQMSCDDTCFHFTNLTIEQKIKINYHEFYKVPEQNSDSNYWSYFEEALLHNMCLINYTSEVKCNMEKSHHNSILSDNAIWDNFVDENFFDKNFERDKKTSASKLAYSMCHNCPLVCDRVNTCVLCKIHEVSWLLSLGISASLLISACAVYLMTPKLRRNINGKSTICHLVALIVTAIFLFIDRIKNFTDHTTPYIGIPTEKNITNKLTGLVIWYSTLSAFFWLNSICLDIFIVFWRGRCFFIKESSRLKIYMVFSWGLPLVITLIIDIVTWNKPEIARQYFYTKVFSSWVENEYEHWGSVLIRWLWNVPITISLLLNLLIFAATAWVLHQHSRKLKILEGGNSGCSNRANLSRASIYLRLFSLVGLHWVVQMYAWRAYHRYHSMQIIGNFQGSITFLMLIWRRSTIKAFKTRHNDKQNPGKLNKIIK